MVIPDSVVLIACLLATAGLTVMAVLGHNRVVIVMAVSYLWLATAYACYLAGFVTAPGRMTMVKAGLFVLGLSTFGSSLVWLINRKRHE